MNPGDATAQGRFQRISLAYELLRDPNRRAQYDASGRWSSGAAGQEQAEETFRNAAQDREVMLELLQLYIETVREEAWLAAEFAREGRWKESWALVREHRGLLAGAGALLLVLRFPAAVGMAARLVVASIMHPAVFRVVLRAGLSAQVWRVAWT